MASLNKVFLMGNLTREPELRYTPSGSAVCEFGIAVNRRFSQNGQDRDEPCFVEIIVWEKQAEASGKFLQKGSAVFIEGRLQYDQWVDKEQKKRSRLRVVAERVQFLDRRDPVQAGPDAGGVPPQQQGGGYRRGTYQQPAPQDGPDGGYAPRSQYRSQYQQPRQDQQGGQQYRQSAPQQGGGLPPQMPSDFPPERQAPGRDAGNDAPPPPPEEVAGIEDDIPF